MDVNIQETSEEFIRAVNLIMNPFTSAKERHAAHKIVEDFKDMSPLRAKCGFQLCFKSNPPAIRHCGFQLIDHHVRFHWNTISCDEKIWIKTTIMEIIVNDIGESEESFVKDAVSRIVVELVKREWPQQWPSFMAEMHELCCKGSEQTEMVLLVFTRLAEDVALFMNVPGEKRRREIYKTLCAHLDDLFSFFWKTLQDYMNDFEKSGGGKQQCRRVQVVLETISTFMEWCPFHLVTPLRLPLGALLRCPPLCTHALTTLFSALQRKGKPEERKELLVFFEVDELFKNVYCGTESLNHEEYRCTRLLLECLGHLGGHLTTCLLQQISELNLSLFLHCTLSYVGHPSVILSQEAHSIWLNLLKCPALTDTPLMESLLPTLLNMETEKSLKLGYPSKQNSVTCTYSAMEFDSDEDFESGFTKLRVAVGDVVRQVAKLHPNVAFCQVDRMLKLLLCGRDWSELLNSNVLNNAVDVEVQLLCWESMVSYIAYVSSPLSKSIHTKEVEELSPAALSLLELCISYTSNDPARLSYALSCISALFFFLTYNPRLRGPVIDKVFSHLTRYKLDDLNEDVPSLRRHATSLLIKLSSSFSSLILPEFPKMYSMTKSLFHSDEHLTCFDKCALLESIILLNNHFNEFDKQSEVLKEAISSIEPIWFLPEFQKALESSEHLITFLGLHKEVRDDVDCTRTSQLNLALNVLKVCIKRSTWPTDAEVATKGGFRHLLSDSLGSTFFRNPVAAHALPMLNAVLKLFKALNGFYDPASQQKLHPSYNNILQITETDRNIILGNSVTEKYSHTKSSYSRLQVMIHSLYECCLCTLGACVENLELDFYSIPGLQELLMECIFQKFHFLPAMQLKSVIRVFLRPFFLHCPSSQHDTLLTLLYGMGPFMLQKLSGVWKKFKDRYGSSVGYENQQTEVDEILEDQMNRLLTREYISFLVDILVKQKNSFVSEEDMEDDGNSRDQTKLPLTELGTKIVNAESVRGMLVCSSFESVSWLDSNASGRATQLSTILFQRLAECNWVREPAEADFLLQSVLLGLRELGQHENNLGLLVSLGLTLYETLQPLFPHLRQVLAHHCPQPTLMETLERAITGEKKIGKGDKFKKDAFKAVVANIIGKNVGEQHQRPVEIRNLPALVQLKRKHEEDLILTLEDGGLCKLFCSSSSS